MIKKKSQLDPPIEFWLVVWLPFFIFPYIGLLITPIDFHIFQRGGLTTNQLCFVSSEEAQMLGVQDCEPVNGSLSAMAGGWKDAGFMCFPSVGVP